MREGMQAETIGLAGWNGDSIIAYQARPLGTGPHPTVIVVHHLPGWDDATKEITRRFAAEGYIAVCPHLHYREGPDSSPEDAAAASRAAGGVPDERFLGDADGALRHLRRLPDGNGKVGIVGFCSGGRQAFLAACSLPVDAAVDCYGGYVAARPAATNPVQWGTVIDKSGSLGCPLLGLFGAEDSNPAPAEVAEIERVLRREGKTFDFEIYPDAGHAFFARDRVTYRPAVANAAWARLRAWFDRHLGTTATMSR